MKEFRDIWQNNYENRPSTSWNSTLTALEALELRITVISSASIGEPLQADV
jgi:hypothetical protein